MRILGYSSAELSSHDKIVQLNPQSLKNLFQGLTISVAELPPRSEPSKR